MHLYLHIPFCHRICPYCSFHKHTPAKTNMKEFVDAMLVEARSKQGQSPAALKTVYFGGGTPSMLSDRHLGRLFSGLRDIFDWSGVEEVTFETNPATFNAKRAAYFQELGITRVSLGIQSWDDAILKTLGREHSPGQAAESIRLLREVGMPDINVDLMFSIPGQSLEVWKDTLLRTLEQNPEHISAYNLTYEEDTDFFHKLGEGEWTINEEREAEFFELTDALLTQGGYRHYEVSNFAREDRLSRHNLAYWLGNDYIGLGPGAVGTRGGIRSANRDDTERYIRETLKNGIPPHDDEPVTPDMYRTERIALLLRTDMGLPLRYLTQEGVKLVHDLEAEGLLREQNSHIILTPRGRLVTDEIALQLI